MTKQESDILIQLKKAPYTNQRDLAALCGCSLGVVNQGLKSLAQQGFLTAQTELTKQAEKELAKSAPENAIILAAGAGIRMVPINTEIPKAFIEIYGEPLIERTIRHLHEAGVKNIYIVVGFLKEQFEYLIDKYGVQLVINSEYFERNNLHSLYLASENMGNTYIIPCDIWTETNPYNQQELYSWYMMSDAKSEKSELRVNRKSELIRTDEAGNVPIGISYITKADAPAIREKLQKLDKQRHTDKDFWEAALFEGNKMTVTAKVVPDEQVFEINTYEQLRDLDQHSSHLKTDAIEVIADVFSVKPSDITNIKILKKGMTNRSFLFNCGGEKYIMRIPGEGTDQLINRGEEAEVYRCIAGRDICDDPIYINPENGYKITKFLNGVRVCDAENETDLHTCMKKLREFHEMKITVDHVFDIFEKIDFYESLWAGAPSVYRDYDDTKANVFKLKSYIDEHALPYALTHIDAVPDNFLFTTDETGRKLVQLTDWEYASMQDQDVDLAMFSIYSLYDREQIDRLIDIYFEEAHVVCTPERRIKIYAYVAACGLLWSDWCEYKRTLGIEFGEYAIKQYRYAKEFYRAAIKEIEKLSK